MVEKSRLTLFLLVIASAKDSYCVKRCEITFASFVCAHLTFLSFCEVDKNQEIDGEEKTKIGNNTVSNEEVIHGIQNS